MKSRPSWRGFIKAVAAGTALAVLPLWLQAGNAATERKPNIILILADDLGLPGVSCYGGKYPTPRLDEMAKGGLRFDNCFSAPLCAPSRAMLMTGRFPFRTGVVGNSANALSPQVETITPKLLKQAGYATALAGKWSQLSFMSTVEEGRAWGFDEFLTWDPAAGGRYWKPSLNRSGQALAVTEKDYGPDLLNTYVLDFIERHKTGPFFVYYPMTLIHSQLEPPPGGTTGNGLLADNIAYMDKLVGRLLDELDRLKLRENTLVLFSGDNGLGTRSTIDGLSISGGKGSLLEGGSRVPLIANWMGVIPAGREAKDLVEFTDFYATIAELAGVKLPENVTLDSRSFASLLKGPADRPREWVFIQLIDQWYVRDARWKLTQSGELFDMREAPHKEIPVPATSTEADAVAARKRLQAVLDELKPTASRRGDHAPGANRRLKKEKSDKQKPAQKARQQDAAE